MNIFHGKFRLKAVSFTLIFLMVFGMVPFNGFAKENGSSYEKGVIFQLEETGYMVGTQAVESDVKPYISNERIMVPVAYAASALGAQVIWNHAEKKVSVVQGEDIVSMTIGSNILMKNDEFLMEMETSPVIVDIGQGLGRTMLPVSRLAEVLNVEYTWDSVNKRAIFYPATKADAFVFDKEGEYGKDEEIEVVDKDVYVKADKVILQNYIINGDLIISEDVGDGDVTLNNIEVNGNTYIEGGGIDSIHINGGKFKNIIIRNTPTRQVRLVFRGEKDRDRLNVEIDEDASDQILILEGLYDRVGLNSSNFKLVVGKGSRVNEISVSEESSDIEIETREDSQVEKLVADGRGVNLLGSKATIKLVTGRRNGFVEDRDGVVEIERSSSGGSSSGGGATVPAPVPTPEPGPTPDPTPEPEPDSEFAGGDGSVSSPYLVSSIENLNNIRNYIGEEHKDMHFKQVADIDFAGSSWSEGEGWNPIGDETTHFEGSYDGDNKIIKNLRIDRKEMDRVGLFGKTSSDSKIINVNLMDGNISGNKSVGGLVGENKGYIKNSRFKGNVQGENRYVGGLVGHNNGGTIEEGTVEGTVKGKENKVGGLVGLNRGVIKNVTIDNIIVSGVSYIGGLVGRSYPNNSEGVWDLDTGIIENCHTNKNVNVTGESNSIGGLVGDNGLSVDGGKILKSSSSATVKGGFWVGGLVGANSALISKSFSNGAVLGTETSNGGTGGLAGYNWGRVENSYSISEVSGPFKVGGLVGRNAKYINKSYSAGVVIGTGSSIQVGGLVGDFQSGNVEESHWDKEASGQTSGAGASRTTIEMTNTEIFDVWDFDNTWTIKVGESYPYLKWQGDNNIPYPPKLVAPTTHRVTFAAMGGTIEATVNGEMLTNGSMVDKGSSLEFTATPGEGWELKHWKVNGTVDGSLTSNKVTIAPVEVDYSIEVEFKPITYTINYSVIGGNGNINASSSSYASVSDGMKVNRGTEITFTSEPNSGYRVKDWKVNEASMGASLSVVLTFISEDTNVTLELEEIPVVTYPLTVKVEPSEAIITVTDSSDNVMTGSFNGIQTSYDLPVGIYTINVEKEGYVTKEITQNMIGPSSHIITLDLINNVPVANDDSETVVNNMTILIDVLENDTDEDGDTLSISSYTQGTKE